MVHAWSRSAPRYSPVISEERFRGMSKMWPCCLCVAFVWNRTCRVAFRFHLFSPALFPGVSGMSSSWYLVSEKFFYIKKKKTHRKEALEQGAGSWRPSLAAGICASDVSARRFTSNQRGSFTFPSPEPYLRPTIAKRGGRLKRRTTLSCLRLSIHAGMSAHSPSVSVSLRLAKRSGTTSVHHYLLSLLPFVHKHMREFKPAGWIENMKCNTGYFLYSNLFFIRQ